MIVMALVNLTRICKLTRYRLRVVRRTPTPPAPTDTHTQTETHTDAHGSP
jgi:hypothetical protein